jgi:hypothetical protein
MKWAIPLLLAASLLCCLIAYGHHERQADAEWDSVMDRIAADVPQRR